MLLTVRLLLLSCLFLLCRLASPVEAACGSVSQASSSSSGAVTSHSTFGSSSYSASMNCQWTVTIPAGKYVMVTVSSLDLAAGDCLRVLRSLDGVELTSVCDGTATGTLITLTSSGLIRFTSDGAEQATGFRLTLTPTTSTSSFSGTRYMLSSSGSLSSHSAVGISSYTSNLKCYWYIRVPEGMFVRVQFVTAELESYYDKVYLYYSAASYSMSGSSYIFTGSLTSSNNNSYYSVDRYMGVYFYTDSSVTRNGFRMVYEAVNSSGTSGGDGCGRLIMPDATGDGFVTSHSGYDGSSYYSSSYYSANMNCEWTVTLSSSSAYVIVSVVNLNLDTGDCLRVLRVSDGVELTSVCDGTANGTLITLTNQSLIRFTSDSSEQSTGFRLRLSLTSADSCDGTRYMYSRSGSFSSHSGVDLTSYSVSMGCYWYIRVPSYKTVRVWFRSANTESCCDYIYLFDGSSARSSNRLASISGSLSSNKTYESSSRYMIVYFYSDSSTSRTGFRLYFEAVAASSADSNAGLIIGLCIGGAVLAFICFVGFFFCWKSFTKTTATPRRSAQSTAATTTRATNVTPSRPRPPSYSAASRPALQQIHRQRDSPPPYSDSPPPYPGTPPPHCGTPPPSCSSHSAPWYTNESAFTQTSRNFVSASPPPAARVAFVNSSSHTSAHPHEEHVNSCQQQSSFQESNCDDWS